MRVVPKGWGFELWLVMEPEYWAKLLFFLPDKYTSYHYHEKKKETMIVLSGDLEIAWNGDLMNVRDVYYEGKTVTIKPGTGHSLGASSFGPCLVLEVSTPHVESDSMRTRMGSSQNTAPEDWPDPFRLGGTGVEIARALLGGTERVLADVLRAATERITASTFRGKDSPGHKQTNTRQDNASD